MRNLATKPMTIPNLAVAITVLLFLPGRTLCVERPASAAKTLEVGPGKTFVGIEDALGKANPGDTIAVFPLANANPYAQPKLLVRKAGITIRGVAGEKGKRVRLDGNGFNYSGRGPIPRAIVQFDPGADGCVLDGFELCNARNESFNGAGVRINQANRITVRNCDIHDNDMGIMSNGRVEEKTAANQRIEFCRIFGNGSTKQPGYNHNLYLGGTSVILHGCEVFGSTTGHNVKSRAHYNGVECCHIHDSANRELDLVDERGNTDVPESHSVLIGNIIVKKNNLDGNRAVIHFGQDGKNDHQGLLYLVNNTIVTPYLAPVVHLSAPGASAVFLNNLVTDNGAGGRHTLVEATNGAKIESATGEKNWVSQGFQFPGGMKADANWIGAKGGGPVFRDPVRGDWRVTRESAGETAGRGLSFLQVLVPDGTGRTVPLSDLRPQQYVSPNECRSRTDAARPDLGAFGTGEEGK